MLFFCVNGWNKCMTEYTKLPLRYFQWKYWQIQLSIFSLYIDFSLFCRWNVKEQINLALEKREKFLSSSCHSNINNGNNITCRKMW